MGLHHMVESIKMVDYGRKERGLRNISYSFLSSYEAIATIARICPDVLMTRGGIGCMRLNEVEHDAQ